MKQIPFCSSYNIRAIWWSILNISLWRSLSVICYLPVLLLQCLKKPYRSIEYYRHIIDYHTSILCTPFNSSTEIKRFKFAKLVWYSVVLERSPPSEKNLNKKKISKKRTLSNGDQRPFVNWTRENTIYIYYIILLGLLLIFCRNMLG